MARKTSVNKSLLESTINKFYGMSGNISTPVCSIPLEQSLSYDGFGELFFERLSKATYIDRTTRLLKTALTDEPRFEQDGLLLESNGKNYCLQSIDFTNAIWSKSFITVANNSSLDPTGSRMPVSLVTVSNGTAVKKLTYTRKFIDSGLNTVSFSIFVRQTANPVNTISLLVSNDSLNPSPSIKATFNFDSDGYISKLNNLVEYDKSEIDVADYDIQRLENGWSRISISPKFIPAIEATHNISCAILFGTDATSDGKSLYVWGAQIERTWYATSYIPSNGTNTEATRSNEFLRVDTDRNISHISYDYTFALDIKMKGPSRTSNQRIFYTGDLVDNNNREKYRKILWQSSVNMNPTTNVTDGGFVVYGGSTYPHVLPAYVNPKARHRIGFRKSGNETVAFLNGTIMSRDSTKSYTSGSKEFMCFGSDMLENEHFDGYISNIRIYDKALSDIEILMV